MARLALGVVALLALCGCAVLVPDSPVHPWGCSDWCATAAQRDAA